MRTIALTLALSLVAAGVSQAQNPNMGTWKLNEAKSKIPAGAPKNTTVVYAPAGDMIKVTTQGVDAAGKPTHSEWTGKFDGKDYPVTGDPSVDQRSYVQVNEYTLTVANKKAGKVTTTGKIETAKDGKTRKLEVEGTDAAGKKMKATYEYDKQ